MGRTEQIEGTVLAVKIASEADTEFQQDTDTKYLGLGSKELHSMIVRFLPQQNVSIGNYWCLSTAKPE